MRWVDGGKETVLSRNIANTRPRDFYDIHILYTLQMAACDLPTLKLALEETTRNRGSEYVLYKYREIVENILESPQMHGFWGKYSAEYHYAKGISFGDVCRSVLLLMDA